VCFSFFRLDLSPWHFMFFFLSESGRRGTSTCFFVPTFLPDEGPRSFYPSLFFLFLYSLHFGGPGSKAFEDLCSRLVASGCFTFLFEELPPRPLCLFFSFRQTSVGTRRGPFLYSLAFLSDFPPVVLPPPIMKLACSSRSPSSSLSVPLRSQLP